MHGVSRRKSTVIGLVGVVALALPALAGIPAAAAADPSITINDPALAGQPKAGTVELSGNVAEGTSTTTVLYVLDATASTHLSAGSDCNGDGADNAADDLNADGAVGDVLDCEIGAVKKLDSSLISSPGASVMVGVEAFAQLAQVADLNVAGTAVFAAPGDTGGESQPRIITATTSVQRGSITRYNAKSLGASGASYDAAVSTALSAFSHAPAGPKWVMLLSDGKTSVSDRTLAALHSSGVHLSSFAVGVGSSCDKHGALAKMSTATSERCVAVTSPATLATQLINAQPDGIANVTVSIGGTSLAANIDPIGGWRAKFTLGKGSYSALATATLTSGRKVSVSRSFSVSAASGAGAPPPGTVANGPGSLRATAVVVNRPSPSRSRLPSRITGNVGLPKSGELARAKHLNGATVLLQGRGAPGQPWLTVGRGKVHKGAFALNWNPIASIRLLQVAIGAHAGLAASSDAVPTAKISDCTVTHHPKHWSMTCHTTAKAGAKARLFSGSHVVDRTTVVSGLVTVRAKGRSVGHVLVVKHSRKHHAHKAHLAL
jgi:hypothetical protein